MQLDLCSTNFFLTLDGINTVDAICTFSFIREHLNKPREQHLVNIIDFNVLDINPSPVGKETPEYDCGNIYVL